MLAGPPARRWIAVAAGAIGVAVVAAFAVGELRGRDDPGAVSARERAVVWAVGDGANGSAQAQAVAARIAKGPVDRLLYLGDVYEDGTAQDFRENYAPTYGRLARLTAPTSGNHDERNESSGYDPYWQRVLGAPPADWYAFRVGGWQIISLDSEDPHHPGSPQLRWLQGQLRAAGTCRIAFWHRPRFSADTRHGDQGDVAPLWDALRGHAAIVVAGHAHNMQRFRPIDGITEFVSGAGGAELYPLRRDARLAFGDDRTYGAVALRLRREAADYTFVSADGGVLDSGTVPCQA